MEIKQCQGCKYLFGSEEEPGCDLFDRPIKEITECLCPICKGEGKIYRANGEDDFDIDICEECEGKGIYYEILS